MALTIIVVLAGLLAPVFIQAREEAKKAACSFNFRQVSLSTTLYQIDYDDRYVVAKYHVVTVAEGTDRTWVQLVLPYLRSLDSTKCPSDYTRDPQNEAVYDSDLVYGSAAEHLYQISMRANTGFNFVYLSPLVMEPSGQWYARPRSSSELQDPSRTLVFGDSVWSVSPEGQPSGGGSYLIVPPCRWTAPEHTDTFGLNNASINRIYTAAQTWDDKRSEERVHMGGLWPWHSKRMTVIMGDGSARALTAQAVAAGCDVKVRWKGFITNSERYLWDLR